MQILMNSKSIPIICRSKSIKFHLVAKNLYVIAKARSLFYMCIYILDGLTVSQTFVNHIRNIL